ncbi:polysaccharide export protein [Porphyrobacter sp. TH134]|uniref:polysaccharide biosynthesis/export family protein n=1 Tax=Porphyrobacter sp. TH134 TaxID=2067450 RepID=UPI000C7E7A98|nr:polysaccharide biosynthesis/export family protein [Porphyrobacter sp. TH134]PLK25424.1 polysaccharide export protein [Porphyrobacter sp. TH134]
MISITRHFILLGAAGLLAGCATDRSIGLAPEVQVTKLEELPAPRGEISYVVGLQEKLEIEVVGAESLSGTYLTDIDGRLAFPLIGVVELEGRTPSEASTLIADRLRGKFLLDPQVRVIPEEFPVPSISIGGQVKKPGSYPAVGRQTLLRVVNQAEGLTEFAKEDDVLVLRTVDNQRYIGVYNLRAIQRGNYPDPQLFPNDIVMVGDSPERRRIDALLQLLPPILTTAAILISQR